MIIIIDYKLSNLNGVKSAINYLGFEALITNNHEHIIKSSKIILPGVGAFPDAMQNLENLNLVNVLNDVVIHNKKPFLGICLGAQLICKESDEFGKNKGLGWIDATVKKIEINNLNLRLPHTGWDEVVNIKRSHLMNGINEKNNLFYYNHSHAIFSVNDEDVAAYCEYGKKFASIIEKENIFATQFHPEKSQKNGLKLLKNFLCN